MLMPLVNSSPYTRYPVKNPFQKPHAKVVKAWREISALGYKRLINLDLFSLLLLTVEPRPFDSDLIKEPLYSVLGNPVPIRLACAFTGYPSPDVRIKMNGDDVAVGIESVWFELSTDSVDDYGVYYCVAENVVGPSKLNYTFEIRRSGLY